MDSYAEQEFYPYDWVRGIEIIELQGYPPIDVFQSQFKHESVLNDDDKTNKKANHH